MCNASILACRTWTLIRPVGEERAYPVVQISTTTETKTSASCFFPNCSYQKLWLWRLFPASAQITRQYNYFHSRLYSNSDRGEPLVFLHVRFCSESKKLKLNPNQRCQTKRHVNSHPPHKECREHLAPAECRRVLLHRARPHQSSQGDSVCAEKVYRLPEGASGGGSALPLNGAWSMFWKHIKDTGSTWSLFSKSSNCAVRKEKAANRSAN